LCLQGSDRHNLLFRVSKCKGTNRSHRMSQCNGNDSCSVLGRFQVLRSALKLSSVWFIKPSWNTEAITWGRDHFLNNCDHWILYNRCSMLNFWFEIQFLVQIRLATSSHWRSWEFLENLPFKVERERQTYIPITTKLQVRLTGSFQVVVSGFQSG
jgi:hypothetical protein